MKRLNYLSCDSSLTGEIFFFLMIITHWIFPLENEALWASDVSRKFNLCLQSKDRGSWKFGVLLIELMD